jgi:hypothetical protein
MCAQASFARTEFVEIRGLGSGTKVPSVPVRTELVEGLEPVLADVRFDKLSANGVGRYPRFDGLSANGAGRHPRFDRLSENGVLKIPRAERQALE